MPEIAALAAAPAPPTLIGVSTTTPQAPAGDGAASFMTQLQAALGSLGLFSKATPTTPQAADPTAPKLDLPATEEDHDESAELAEILPEVLAALGFVPVPITLPLAPPPAPKAGFEAKGSVASITARPVRAQAPLVQPALSHAEPVTAEAQPIIKASVPDALLSQMTPVTTDQPFELPAVVPTTPLASPAVTLPSPVPPVDLATSQPSAAPQIAPATSPVPSAPLPPVAATTTTTTTTTTATVPQPLEALTAQAGIPTPRAEPATRVQQRSPVAEAPVSSIGQPQPIVNLTSFGQTTGNDAESSSDDPSSDVSKPIELDRAATPTDGPIQAFASVAASANTQPIDPLSDVKPAHVVSQIAHQADLYRLPGGRGVRIELNPEDLGGVGVTIKYSTTGGLELHIVAEQAATAQLVQSGWSDLRSALSLQGIAPERLIMSVSSPSESNASSSGSGSQAAFGQAGQSNHQRHDRNDAQANRGWAGFGDAPINVNDDVRSSGAVSNSRIDYRV